MRDNETVYIGWIDPGLVDGAFATSLLELWQHRPHRLGGFIRIEGGLISRQRNEVVQRFLESESEWLLMIDSDEQLSVAAFDLLIDTAHAAKRPVIGGLYFGTWPNPGGLYPQPIPHLYRQARDGVSVKPVIDYPQNSVIEIDAVGTGCLLVHRSVLEAIRSTADEHEGELWCWFRDLPLKGMWLGEDLYFCRRIRALGFKIHAHTGAVLPHRRKHWLDDRPHEAARQLREGSRP